MCGIAGLISQIQEYRHVSHLFPILKSLTHRGPDSTETAILDDNGCFDHNRLSIVDLNERAKQPMWDHSRRYCITFNGEIYNFQALRQDLGKLGHHFRTQSDTEVLIQAWAEWGVSALDRLVGMFAFAIWDKQLNVLYLVRDRMGEKPLYYAPINKDYRNGIVFASELKGLIQYPFLEKKISMTALSHYLSYNYTSTEDAIFQGFYKLSPACFMQYTLKNHQTRITEYWSLANSFQDKLIISFETAQNKLESLIQEVVKQKTVADVPLGAFLSGGIDSSVIVNHMQKNNLGPINTYTIGFREKSYNEVKLSNKTAAYLGVNHFTQIVSPDLSESLSRMVHSFDEPFADSSLIPTYFLCEFARKYVKVSLSGDGGDELFGGYITYQADRYYKLIQNLPFSVREKLYSMSRFLPTSFKKVSWDYKIKHFLRGTLLDMQNAHLSWREVFTSEQKKCLFLSEYHDLISYDVKTDSIRLFQDVQNCHYLDQAMYVDMKTWLVNDILLKVDRASMAHSLEVRSPFLDHRLVEFAAKLPVSYKIQRGNGKRILKAAHSNQLPAAVLRQPKKGFNSPISNWLCNELFKMGYAVTMNSHLSQWFNKKVIEKLWFEHRKGVCDNGHRLFNLLCLGLWCQNYL